MKEEAGTGGGGGVHGGADDLMASGDTAEQCLLHVVSVCIMQTR